ncbi:MAG: elongation factor P [Candidatus Dadabacteria bacterium]|nr:elongation factor P [Candidatus Dadabacteria bacterium]NIQ13734.1 elongation factor P [Candidatus Dadabacteria bacterium]
MGVVDTSRFYKGLKIEYDGDVWEIVGHSSSKMGRQGAIVTTKLKNIITGAFQEKKFRSGEKFNTPDLRRKKVQYLYKDDIAFYFMDTETFEQQPLSHELVGDMHKFLKEQEEVELQIYNDEPIGIELPTSVEYEVTYTEPGIKGDTVSSTTKPATIETGAVINVPLFINIGDKIRVDTRNGNYLERVKS